jgi:hypothetical protein
VLNKGNTSELKQTVSDFTVGIGLTTIIPVLSALLGCVIDSWVQDNEKMKNIAPKIKVLIE